MRVRRHVSATEDEELIREERDDASSDEDADDDAEVDAAEGLPFQMRAWSHVYAFIRNPEEPLKPLADFRSASSYLRMRVSANAKRALFDIKVNAHNLGFRALWKAAEAAIAELDEWVSSRRVG